MKSYENKFNHEALHTPSHTSIYTYIEYTGCNRNTGTKLNPAYKNQK